MKIQYKQGDLFKYIPKKPVLLAHVVNNQGRMGSGFVVPLIKKWPQVKQEYEEWCTEDDLGSVLYTKCGNVIVANMCAQILGGERPLYYNKLVECMENVAHYFKIGQIVSTNTGIIAPKFGSALAGGNWSFIEELIKDIWLENNIPVTIFVWEK